MKNSPKEKPEIVPSPSVPPTRTVPETNPVKPDLPEVAPDINKMPPAPISPEINPTFPPEIKQNLH